MTDFEASGRITLDTSQFEAAAARVRSANEGMSRSFEESNKGIAGSMGRLGGRLSSLASAATGPLGMIARAAVDTARRVYDLSMSLARVADDAADVDAYLKRTFGSRAGEAKRWAAETAEAYGAYTATVESYYTRMYEALAGSGMGRDKALAAAQDLVKLRYDLSAVLKWYGEEQIEGWLTDIAVQGKEEAFRKLLPGREFEAAAKELGLYSESMSEAERRIAMLRILSEEYGDELGSWTENLKTASGASERLDASVKRLSESIGSVLSPVLAALINTLADVVDGINAVGEAIGGLLGSGDNDLADAASLAREVSDAMRQLKEDTDAASEASAGLAGFDRLNRLDDKDSGGEERKEYDWSGLNAWMLMWQADAEAASTSADDLWAAILASGETTAEGLKGRFGDLFEWMRSNATVDVDVQDSAIDTAYSKLSETVAQYRSAVESLGITLDDVPDLAGASDRLREASERVSALTVELAKAKASGKGAEAGGIEQELAKAIKDRDEAERQAKLAESVDALAKAYGAGIQGIYGKLAVDMGAYTGQIVSALSSGSIREVREASDDLKKAVGGISIPKYADEDFRADVRDWLQENRTKVAAAIGGLPEAADIADVLAAFEGQGIQVSDTASLGAAVAIAKLLESGGTHEDIEAVARAVDSITIADYTSALIELKSAVLGIPAYSDLGLRTDLSRWLSENEDGVARALKDLPVNSTSEDILAKFAENGVMVDDPQALAAAQAISALAGTRTLLDLVNASGGVASAVAAAQLEQTGNIAGMSADLSQWIGDNEDAVTAAVGRLPVGSDYQTILDEFESQGIDVADPNAQAAAQALSTMPLDVWTRVGGISGLQKALKPDVPDISPSLDGIAGAISGIEIPDQEGRFDALENMIAGIGIPDDSSRFDAIEGMLRDIEAGLTELKGEGLAQAVEDAQAEVDEWDRRQKEAAERYAQSVSSPGGALPVQSFLSGLQFAGETVYNAIGGARAGGDLQKAKNEARAVPETDPLEGLSQRIQLKGYAERGTSWSGLPARLRPAVDADTWEDALLYYAGSGGAKSDRYSDRRSEVPANYRNAIDARMAGGVPFEGLPRDILETLEGLGIRGYASGGVFAPNSPVLGVLGDNRREVEVAAPYSTIVRAVKDAMGLGGLGGGSACKVELTANMVIDGRTVARQIYPYIIEEGRRVGRAL